MSVEKHWYHQKTTYKPDHTEGDDYVVHKASRQPNLTYIEYIASRETAAATHIDANDNTIE